MAGTLTISTLSDGTNSTSSTNCIQGSAKAWVNYNGNTGAIRASYNVSSVTRNSTGVCTITFTNALPDANYSTVGGVFDNGVACFNNWLTTSIQCYTRLIQGATGTIADYANVCVTINR